MITYEDDFTKNTNIILEFIQHLFENAAITVEAFGLYYDDDNPRYQLDDMLDLDRFQRYLQQYLSSSNAPLKHKRYKRVIDPKTGRMKTTINEDDYTLEDLVIEPHIDYATSNYEMYIIALKRSSRYDEHTGFVDHVPTKHFYKQLCLFRFLYKYYFPQGTSPLGVDKFFFAFKNAFCASEKTNTEGLIDAAFQTATLYHVALSKHDVVLKNLKSDSIHIDVLRKEREQLCKNYLEAEETSAQHADYYQQYWAMLYRRNEFSRKLLECAATVYARGFEETYESFPYFHDVMRYIRQPNRDIDAHGRRNFEQIFSPVYFEFRDEGACVLKEYYEDQNFFAVVSTVLIKCSTLRRRWNRKRAGRFLRWAHGFQFGKIAEAFIDLLNGGFAHIVHQRGNSFRMFQTDSFRETPYAVLTHCFDHDNNYRQAYQVLEDLRQTRNQSRAAASGITQRINGLDREINRGLQKLDRDVEDIVASIATRHKMFLREKVLRKISERHKSLSSKSDKGKGRKSILSSSGDATVGEGDELTGAAGFSRQDSVFAPDTVSKVGGVDLPGRQSSVIAAQRGMPPMHPEEEQDMQFAENFCGEEDKDFIKALNMIMENCGDFTKLINLHKRLSRTYLAREAKVTVHVTWTGTERRKCTKEWSHIERIIQILSLANMVTRNVKLANITRITNHYFFLITDRHYSPFVKKNKKVVCGMAQRFFKDLRKKDPQGAMVHLGQKWKRYVELYNLPELNTTEVVASGRGELGEGALPSLSESDEPR